MRSMTWLSDPGGVIAPLETAEGDFATAWKERLARGMRPLHPNVQHVHDAVCDEGRFYVLKPNMLWQECRRGGIHREPLIFLPTDRFIRFLAPGEPAPELEVTDIDGPKVPDAVRERLEKQGKKGRR